MKSVRKVKTLCIELLENNGKIHIHGEDYNKGEVVDFARKFEPTVITLHDALGTIRKLNLFQELKRVLIDKDDKYQYGITSNSNLESGLSVGTDNGNIK